MSGVKALLGSNIIASGAERADVRQRNRKAIRTKTNQPKQPKITETIKRHLKLAINVFPCFYGEKRILISYFILFAASYLSQND